MLSLGPQGPFWADNGSQFLAPFFTRQAEIGAKYEPGQRILLTGALFRMRAPFFYPKVIGGPDDYCPAGAALPAISASSRKAAKHMTASSSTLKAKPPVGSV
jgi:hypothetical protein